MTKKRDIDTDVPFFSYSNQVPPLQGEGMGGVLPQLGASANYLANRIAGNTCRRVPEA